MFDLTGKAALVTGATGRHRRRHRAGAARAGRDGRALRHARARRSTRWRANSASASTSSTANLADKDAVEALVPAAEAAMGRLDILVNNAGVTRDNLFLRMKDEEWEQVIARQPRRPPSACSRAAVKGMMRRRYGRIVNITSVVGVTGNPGQGNYAASKAGLIGMTQVARRRGREPQHHRQLRRAGLHRDADDRRAEREAAARRSSATCRWAGSATGRRDRRGGRLPRQRGGRPT